MSPKEKKKKRKKKHKSNRKYEEIHELSYYLNDRLKLMKEVVKIMKPHKIKSMAPEFLKDVKFDDLMFLLMDELLGISKKRLKYIFSGKSDDIASSSCTDSEEEEKKLKQTDDVISLSDITSDDDDLVFYDEKTIKDEVTPSTDKRIKKEKGSKIRKTSKKQVKSESETTEKDKLMSVLELLELQARARAIRSQLALETKTDNIEDTREAINEDSDPEAVVIQSPKKDEIVISSSDSENEEECRKKQKIDGNVCRNTEKDGNPKSWEGKPSRSIIQNNIICGNRKTQKIKIIRDRTVVPTTGDNNTEEDSNKKGEEKKSVVCEEKKLSDKLKEQRRKSVERRNSCSDNEPDVIVINLDESDDLHCEDT